MKMAIPESLPTAAPRGRRVSWGLLFMFTLFPPGVNYMFMGLIKRGLAALCGFFLLVYLVSVSSGPLTLLFGLTLPVYWLTCAFDGFNIRRRIRAGEVVDDSIDGALSFLRSNKYIVWVALGLVALSILGSVVGIIMKLVVWLMPIAIISLGLYLLFKGKTPPGPPEE